MNDRKRLLTTFSLFQKLFIWLFLELDLSYMRMDNIADYSEYLMQFRMFSLECQNTEMSI